MFTVIALGPFEILALFLGLGSWVGRFLYR
jgi:hypothetical protein